MSQYNHPLLDEVDSLIDRQMISGSTTSYVDGTVKMLVWDSKERAQLLGRLLRSLGFEEITLRGDDRCWRITADSPTME